MEEKNDEVEMNFEDSEPKKDLHTTTDPVDKYEKIDLEDKTEYISSPTGTNSKTTELSKQLDSLPAGEFEKKYKDNDNLIALNVSLGGERNTNREDIYGGLTEEELVNEVKYGEKSLEIKPVTVNSKKNVISGDTAVAMFTSSLGIGNIMHIPLWNSGFWISIRPPEDPDIINLDIALSNYELELGRNTNTLVYSNYSVIFIKLVTDFIENHIMNSSLKLNADESIMDHILISDLYPMILGIITAMYPKGYEITKGCKNTLVADDDGNLKCNFIATGKVNPRKMLFVNRQRINSTGLEHMAKRQPNSVTVDMVKNYQKLVNSGEEKVFDISNSSKDIKVTLKSPTISAMIESGELWVNTIISKAEEAFTKTDTDVVKNKKINDIVKSSVLGIYNIYTTKIEFENNGETKSVVDTSTINTLLNVISSEDDIVESYSKAIKSYINDDMISMVGMPDFICPNCKEAQLSSDSNPAFKEIIPINMLEDFFDLSALRAKKIRNKETY